MELKPLTSVWYRQLNPGDFFTIERSDEARPVGGGGQGYVDIPSGARDSLFEFLGKPLPTSEAGPWEPHRIMARAIGDPSQVAEIEFSHRGGSEGNRYRVANQRRQGDHPGRHPAWLGNLGFPKAPDSVANTAEAAKFLPPGGVRLYVAKTNDGEYYAGFTQGSELPKGWPRNANLEDLFADSSGGLLVFPSQGVQVSALVAKVFDAWKRKPNALLYGPPGTGKTHTMSIIRQLLQSGVAAPAIGLDPTDTRQSFQELRPPLPFPTPVAQDWVTFHQSYSYEDFILGLRPHSSSAGSFELRPRLGRLLDLAVRVSRAENAASAVLFIDEINRGNVARIFGEFITFMEFDYRDTDSGGASNPRRLPVPLPLLDVSADETEDLQRPSGGVVKLPQPWFFPRHVYTLSSMNSVDRTVAPLDSALARRVERIEIMPDEDLLASRLGINQARVREKVLADSGTPGVELEACESAWVLLGRLNHFLTTTLGPDFALGHAYFWDVGLPKEEEARFESLAIAWDRFVYPQLQERFALRPEELFKVLKVEDPNVPADYAFRPLASPFGHDGGDRPALDAVSLIDLARGAPERLKRTLRFLACP